MTHTHTHTHTQVSATAAVVKIYEQTFLNVISVYFPNEPRLVKNIALSNKKWVIAEDLTPMHLWGKVMMYSSDLS